MSVSIEMVEFERREAFLSELDNGPPYTVHGIALGEDDVTVGQSGIKKLWPAEELAEAADTLEGKNLVVDHDNSSSGVVGTVTKAGYKEGVGVLYEAELFDDELAEKIDGGLLEVSVRGYHVDVAEMEEDEETGAKVVEDIEFENLSIVPTGAAPSNTIDMGETEELSAGQIQVYAASLQEEEDEDDDGDEDEDEPEFEPGDTVQWGDDQHGIVLDIDEDEQEAEVDVYEQDDGTWRSTGEETTVSFSSLDSWDVDMDNIGKMMDEEENSDEELDSNYSIRKPDFDGTTESEWNKPSQSDFDTDDLQEIGTHFIGVQGDWPADNYGDLVLPVVEPNGDLNLNALEAVRGGRGVKSLDPEPSDEMVEDVFKMTANLANNNFDVDWSKDVEEASSRGEGEEGKVGRDITKADIKCWSPERYPEDAQTSDELEVSPAAVMDILETFIEEHGRDVSLENFSDWADEDVDKPIGLFTDSTELDDPSVGNLHDWMVDWMEQAAGDEIYETEEEALERAKELGLEDVHRLGDGWMPGSTHEEFRRAIAEENQDDEEDEGDEDPSLEDVPEQFRFDSEEAAAEVAEEMGISGAHRMDDVWVPGASHEEFLEALEEYDSEEEASDEPTHDSAPVTVLTGDDFRRRYKSGESEQGSVSVIEVIQNMTNDIEEKLAELNEPVAVEKEDLDELQEKADQFEEMNSSLEDLRERTEVLDEVDREQVEELAESEEPIVLESSRYEQLTNEAEQVKNVYAAALAEDVDVFDADELTDRFSIEELREKYEERIGDPEEELAPADPDPRSEDPSEEELSEKENEPTEEEKEAEKKQAELREQILGDD